MSSSPDQWVQVRSTGGDYDLTRSHRTCVTSLVVETGCHIQQSFLDDETSDTLGGWREQGRDLFIVTDKRGLGGEEGRRCRCYERHRVKGLFIMNR